MFFFNGSASGALLPPRPPPLLPLHLPHHSPLHHAQKNTHLQPRIASFTHRIEQFETDRKSKAIRSARCTDRGRTCLPNTPRVKAALPGVSTPTRSRSLTPTHCEGKQWKRGKFPRVKNTEQKQQMSGDAAGRRGVFPPNIHTHTPPFTTTSTTTTPLPLDLPPEPGEPPTPNPHPQNLRNLRTYLNGNAQKSPISYLNPQSHARCRCCLSSSPHIKPE